MVYLEKDNIFFQNKIGKEYTKFSFNDCVANKHSSL